MPVEALSILCNNLTKKIKKLSLWGIRGGFSQEILEEEHVIALANRCPQLEELDLGYQRKCISELVLSTIIEKLPNLVKLRLPDVGQIQFPKVLRLGSMPNLKHLYVDSKSPVIKELLKNLPNLKINEGTFEIAHSDPRNLGYLSQGFLDLSYGRCNASLLT